VKIKKSPFIVIPKERTLKLLRQAGEAISRGGRGNDITNVPSEKLFERYCLMSNEKEL
jgi:hypothetical protein